MSELLFLGLEVAARRFRRRDLERQPLADGKAVAFDAHELARVVAQEPHRSNAKLAENLARHGECVVNLPAPSMWQMVEKLAPLFAAQPGAAR